MFTVVRMKYVILMVLCCLQMDVINVDYWYDHNYIEGAKSGRRSFVKQQSKTKLTHYSCGRHGLCLLDHIIPFNFLFRH